MAQLISPSEVDLKLIRPKPSGMKPNQHTLCPGCGEAVAGRVLAEVFEEMGVREKAIGAFGVGCYLQITNLVEFDLQQSLHGRAPGMATGIKRSLPDALVFTMQGDGDLLSEGLNEALHAAARGENITIICLNNGVNGETGGHLTAGSVVGQRTKTTLDGRSQDVQGSPVRMAELLATVDGTCFSARSAMHKPSEIQKAKKYLKRAFELQMKGAGFTYVELITMCPTGWFMDPLQAIDFIDETFSETHHLGVFKDRE